MRPSLPRALAILLAAAPLSLATPVSDASASTIAQLDTEQLTDASTYVVRGTVTRVWVETDAEGRDWTRAELAVAHVLKGPDTPRTLVVDSLGSDRMPVHGAARFSQGEDLVVFLDRLGDGRLAPVSMFWGKLSVRRAPGDARSYAVRWQGRPDERFDARFLPHPAPTERLYLDELLARVEARLDVGWDGRAVPGLAPPQLHQVNTPEIRRRR